MSELSTRPPRPVVGVEMPHESADLHVTGLALYTDDLVSRYPGALHAYPVQAPHAHAHVRSMDTAPALAVPGVVYVLTAADVPGVNDAGVKHDEPLFPSEVMYYGHPVCWVLAETLEAARIGATKVAVEYEPLPSLITIKEAIAAESYQGSRPVLRRGEPEAAFPGCAHVFEGEFEFAGQEHFYLETNAALASIDENGQIFVQSSTQHPTETQDIVSHVLGKPNHEVTVQCLRMGGGFGGKEMQPHGYAAIAALGTVVTGRPVRVRFNRTQDITISGKRHGFHALWKVGFAEDGTIQALTATLTADGGWSLDLSEPVQGRALCHIDNAYWIPNIEVHGRISKTNKTSQTAFRGFGGPQGMIVIENILGQCAPALGMSARELRRRNFYSAGQTTPYGQDVRHPERIERAWSQVLETRRRRSAARRDRGVQRHPRAHQARAGDHPREVRHLVQPDRVQPSRRAGARVQGRLGADQPRRHRDGPGPAHQDAASRGDRARGSAVERAVGADPHRQGAQHLGDGGQFGRRPQRRRGEERLRADQGPAGRGGGRGARKSAPGRRPVRRRQGDRAGGD